MAKYDVLIKEHDAGKMTEERSALLFQVLDNLIPHFGVFKPILSRIREELYGERVIIIVHQKPIKYLLRIVGDFNVAMIL